MALVRVGLWLGILGALLLLIGMAQERAISNLTQSIRGRR